MDHGPGTDRLPLTLPVFDVRIETPRTRSVRLSLSGNVFEFSPGQAVRVGLHGQSLRKPYSIACAPEQAWQQDALDLLIQVGTDGSAGPHLGVPVPDMPVDVEGPVGEFRFPANPSGRRFLFVAGGAGIAPLRSMLWHALSTFPYRQCTLVYSVRSADEFAYASEMRDLARRGKIVLRETVTRQAEAPWTGERGRITPAHIAALVEPVDTLCFVCGPPAMVQDVTAWLRDTGVPEGQILSEGSA